jgi:Retrotransposon gag protein
VQDTDSIPAAETVRREIEIQLPKAIEQALEKDVPAALDRALHKATFDMPDPITGEPAEGEVAILPKQKKLMRLKAQLTALEGESARMKAAEQRLKFLNRPHDFDGTGHYVEWREKMDHFMTVLNMPSSEEVSVATSYLKGAALSWWNTEQKRMQDPPTDWCQLLMLLNARYDHLNPVLAARTKLETLKQGSMSLQQYLTEYENCYAHIPHSDEDDKIFRFTFHMRPDLQQRFAVNPLTQRRWDNWPALVTYLSAFLSDAACAEVPRHTQKGSNGAGSSGGGGNPGLKVKGGVQKHTKNPKSQKGAGGKNPASNFTKPMASGEVTRTWSEWGFCLSQNICYGCYQKGHTVDKCPGPVASGHPPKYTRDWAVDLPKEKQAKFRSFMVK